MLSRLISLLSRIPAVKWAFNRLRPLPHSGSIELTPSAADEPPFVAEDAPTVDTSASEDSSPQIDAPAELLANVEPDVVEEPPVPSVEIEAVDAPEPVVSSDVSSNDDAEVATVIAEQAFVSPVEVKTAAVEAVEPVIEDEPASVASEKIEAPALDETPAFVLDADIAVEVRIDNEPAPDVVMEIEPVVADDPAPVNVAEGTITDAPVVAAEVEPLPAPAPKKVRAKVVEPADRAALIRQRWAETGIRMWNPRLHGTGDATLNIQGRIGLLPPEPGETMPRYDKLEFKMLGGQIVCEGVIVEAPAHAGQRSFTRLAEPRGADRSREPVRERQAALA